jgi:hypothetical protein
MKLLLTIGFSAPLLSASVLAAQPPRPGTAEAVRCLVGQGPSGCLAMFQKGRSQTAAIRYVGENPERAFETGRVLSIAYWGRDTKSLARPSGEADVFDVKFARREYTLYIGGANGKTRDWTFCPNPPSEARRLRLSAVC